MSQFPEDLEAQRRSVAQQRVRAGAELASRSPRRSGWLRRGLRVAPALAAVGVTVALAVAVLVLVGHGRRLALATGSGGHAGGGGLPTVLRHPTARVRQELRYIEAASRSATASAACRGRRQPAGPTFVQTAPGRGLLSVLGLLRRAATVADHLPHSEIPANAGIYARFIRRARVTDGVTYWIVPTRGPAVGELPSNRCLAAETAALRAELPRIPAALRAPTLRLQAQLIAYDRRALVPRDSICLVFQGSNMGGYSCGETAAEIVHAGELGGSQDIVSGVVPDGVATVTLNYAAIASLPGMTATGGVLGNVLAVRVPGVSRGPGRFPERIVWRSPQGAVVRTIAGTVDGPGGSAFCRHHPTACGPQSGASSSSSSVSATTPRSTRP